MVKANRKNGRKNNNKNHGRQQQRPMRTRPIGRRKGAARGRGKANYAYELSKRVFNAFHPQHLPLSTPMGPHMMVTTRTSFTTDNYLTLIGTMTQKAYPPWSNGVEGIASKREWVNKVAMSTGGSGITPIGQTVYDADYNQLTIPAPTMDMDDFNLVPAAVSFQVSGTDSLTNASGVVYIGRTKNILATPANDGTTVYGLGKGLISFSNPKIMSVAALTMRPQQVNCLPGNHADLADFEQMEKYDDATGQWNDTNVPGTEFAGFKPGYILNPNNRPLLITVAVQWRLRLSPMNPMHSSLTHYPPTPAPIWHAITSAAEHVANGVEDVAAAGSVGAAGYLASGGAAEGGLLASMGGALEAGFGSAMTYGAAALEAAPMLPLLAL
jgi:hypothetical protein